MNILKQTRLFLNLFGVIAATSSVLLLTSCATHVKRDEPPRYQVIPKYQRQAELSRLKHWRIQGGFSIQQAHEKPKVARFTWNQLGKKEYRVRIASALHLYNVAIFGRHGSVTLWRSETEHETARTPEVLMEKEMGWSLPLSNLGYWLRDLPAPGRHKATYDPYGHLSVLSQQGWDIYYDDYRRFDGYELPRKIELVRKDKGISVKIVIKGWTLFTHNEPIA